jgi:hypothetical protein
METLLGNSSEKQELRFRLNSIRLFHFKLLQEKYYDINFIPLSQFLLDKSLEQKIDTTLFKKGIENFYKYQEALNEDYNFLPLDRVFVGLHKINGKPNEKFDEFGGYYSKYQTYYHLEQISLTSLMGCYVSGNYHKTLTTLELLRSYFHDSIHFNTFRSYKLKYNYHSDIRLEDIHRLQYGFNFRREDGKSFSNLDSKEAKTTRNLGMIMEGVTDDFSKLAIAKIIEDEKISLSDLSHFENVILNEITSTTFKESYPSDDAFSAEEANYLNRINDAYKTVWKLYYQFLNEFSVGSKQDFRNFIFTTMINGDHIAFKDYFNRQLNDVNGFDKLFKSPHF